ncbi:unnamed protein product [Closterium sp. NIES-64]|nr:unnamed protein product [Closterium sp. NIES-64]
MPGAGSGGGGGGGGGGLRVSTLNGVKVYNVSGGKAVPEWISDKKKRALRKDEDYLRRIELIQDLEFKVASTRIKASRDGKYLLASGVYPPQVRVYELAELSLKFERNLDSEIVDFQVLTDDYSKIAFLCADRSVCFHAKFGAYFKTRIPRMGRGLAYDPASCDLLLAASSPEIYRINLEQGQFQQSLQSRSPAVNVIGRSPSHGLVACGGEDGALECFDNRQASAVSRIDAVGATGNAEQQVTAVRFEDTEGMHLAVGTSTGQVLLYDLRSSKPYRIKDHMYGSPIHSIKWHRGIAGSSQHIISTDKRIIKIWTPTTDSNVTSVEPTEPGGINDVCVMRGSGLIVAAMDSPRLQAYFIPSLGPAPRWCSFLENITEELEEGGAAMYDDYKFVTREELNALRLTELLGTNLLRPFMHGFFLHSRLYHKAKSIADPFAWDAYRQQKVKEKIEAQRASRISVQKKLPKVNAKLAAQLMQQSGAEAAREEGGEDEEDEEEEGAGGKARKQRKAAASALADPRFASLFTDQAFQVDEDSQEYMAVHGGMGWRNIGEKVLRRLKTTLLSRVHGGMGWRNIGEKEAFQVDEDSQEYMAVHGGMGWRNIGEKEVEVDEDSQEYMALHGGMRGGAEERRQQQKRDKELLEEHFEMVEGEEEEDDEDEDEGEEAGEEEDEDEGEEEGDEEEERGGSGKRRLVQGGKEEGVSRKRGAKEPRLYEARDDVHAAAFRNRQSLAAQKNLPLEERIAQLPHSSASGQGAAHGVPVRRAGGAVEFTVSMHALSLASANLYDIVQALDPSVMSQIPVAILGDISRDTMVCDSMAVQQQCGQLLDDLVCAATCDPYAGNYVTVNEFVGSTEVAVCLREAEAVFEACKDILFISTSKGATLDLTPYFPDARTFMTQIVGGILRVVMGNDKVQIVLTSTNCIAGNTNVYPEATSCCDIFSSVPDTCTVPNEFTDLLNRPTPPACLAATTTPPVNTPVPAPTPAVNPVPSTSPVPVEPALPSTAAPQASPRISPTPSVPKTPSLPSSPSPPASTTPSPSLNSLPPSSPSPPPPPSPPKAASPPAAAAFVSIISCLVCGVMALLAPALL